MDVNQFVYFIEVCNSGSISKAAEKLHLSQQGLSASIRRLESELSCDLFYRKAGAIVLTDAGKMVRSEAESVIKHIERIRDYCAGNELERGRISVAMTDSLILRLPPKLQQLLVNGNESFVVNITERYSNACEELVYNNECAFGIVYGEPDPKKFVSSTLDVVKQVFIVNLQNPLAQRESIIVHDLSGLPMAITRKGTVPRTAVEKMFRDADAELNVTYECDRPRQTIDIVSNNPVLVARTLYDEITPHDLEKIKILNLTDNPFLMPIRLIYKKDHNLTANERFFKQLILDFYR